MSDQHEYPALPDDETIAQGGSTADALTSAAPKRPSAGKPKRRVGLIAGVVAGGVALGFGASFGIPALLAQHAVADREATPLVRQSDATSASPAPGVVDPVDEPATPDAQTTVATQPEAAPAAQPKSSQGTQNSGTQLVPPVPDPGGNTIYLELVVNASEGANIRFGPGSEYEVRTAAPYGAVVTLTGYGSDPCGNGAIIPEWGYVEYKGIAGWMNLSLTVINDEYREPPACS